jgi:inorganic pyrophosphatase
MQNKKTKLANFDEFEVVIEIPQGSNQKFEINEKTGKFEVNFAFKDLTYPFNYGFIPNTLAEDGDPIDVNVFANKPLKTGDVVKVRPIGIMKMKDRGKQDNKIFAVVIGDAEFDALQDIKDLSELQKTEFLEVYKEIAKQKNKITIFESYSNRAEAIEEIKNSLT